MHRIITPTLPMPSRRRTHPGLPAGFLMLMLLSFCLCGSARAQEARPGIQLQANYTGDVVSNLAGGIKRGTVYLDNINLTMQLDGNRLLGWRGSTLFLYGVGTQGGKPSRLVGDAQGVNNIEAPNTWKLYEAWMQQIAFDGRLSVLAGLYDLNSEFDVIRTAALFLNSSHGIGPDFSQSGKNGPSIFPTTSFGVRAKLLAAEAFYVQAVALDGVPGDPNNPQGTHVRFDAHDGLLLAAEAALLIGTDDDPAIPLASRRRRARYRRISRVEDPPYRAKLALGGWTYTETASTLVPEAGAAQHARNWGLYALAEWDVYREATEAGQGLSVFARVGIASHRVNRFGAYNSAGVVYTGLVPGRDLDHAGLAVAAAHNGDAYQRALRRAGHAVTASEVNLEGMYHAMLTPRLALQAGTQYVINPNTDPARAHAVVMFLRFQASI